MVIGFSISLSLLSLFCMIYRFVKAFEKIANGIEKGIVIRKDDTTT